jgi:hypothetical protein
MQRCAACPILPAVTRDITAYSTWHSFCSITPETDVLLFLRPAVADDFAQLSFQE